MGADSTSSPRLSRRRCCQNSRTLSTSCVASGSSLCWTFSGTSCRYPCTRKSGGVWGFGWRAGMAYYRFTVAVPGIARAPLVAQLCTLAARRLAGVSLDSVATCDDVGIGGATREEALARERSLREAARHADMSIREDKGFSGEDVGELCGMILDLAAKAISLPGSWVAKVATVNCTPRTLSCRAALAACGGRTTSCASHSREGKRDSPPAYP